MNCVLCVLSRLLIGQNRQKCSWYRDISSFQLIHPENYCCECFYEIRNWLFCSFRSWITLLLNSSISSSKHLCLNLTFALKFQGLPKNDLTNVLKKNDVPVFWATFEKNWHLKNRSGRLCCLIFIQSSRWSFAKKESTYHFPFPFHIWREKNPSCKIQVSPFEICRVLDRQNCRFRLFILPKCYKFVVEIVSWSISVRRLFWA